jgi:hypothetical protein
VVTSVYRRRKGRIASNHLFIAQRPEELIQMSLLNMAKDVLLSFGCVAALRASGFDREYT